MKSEHTHIIKWTWTANNFFFKFLTKWVASHEVLIYCHYLDRHDLRFHHNEKHFFRRYLTSYIVLQSLSNNFERMIISRVLNLYTTTREYFFIYEWTKPLRFQLFRRKKSLSLELLSRTCCLGYNSLITMFFSKISICLILVYYCILISLQSRFLQLV